MAQLHPVSVRIARCAVCAGPAANLLSAGNPLPADGVSTPKLYHSLIHMATRR
jgi:hypothetical protein